MKFVNLIFLLFSTFIFSQNLQVVYLLERKNDIYDIESKQTPCNYFYKENKSIFITEHSKVDSMFVDNNWIYAPNRSVTKKLDTGVILSFNDYNKDNKHKQAVLDSVNFFTWNIDNQKKKKILNYDCSYATSTFRNRKYEVWFTYDIPINDGPWKLSGLPGFILEAYTDDNLYHYTAKKIFTDFKLPETIDFDKFDKYEKISFGEYEKKFKEYYIIRDESEKSANISANDKKNIKTRISTQEIVIDY
ncbi:MAG: GLPGLI family protein [Cloacibacterium sp.]